MEATGVGPKYKIGDSVYYLDDPRVAEIAFVHRDGTYTICWDADGYVGAREEDLRPA